MEFWGAEVKVGESVKVDPAEFEACIHLSQAALGEAKKDKPNEPVVIYVKVGEQKFVLGTLSRDKIPQISLELVLEKEFELSHNSKHASVHFCGYKAYYSGDDSEDEFTDSDEDLPLVNAENGKPEKKAEDLKVPESKKPEAKVAASAKQVKVVDPKKDDEEDSDDDSDEDGDFDSSDEEMGDADGDSDEESDSDEDDDEETPKKVDLGKKRPNESASKTPVSKKAKNATPEKTDGKKGGHQATPHPVKKGAKTPNSGAKDKSPKSGGLSCKSCSKTFTSESGLQQHSKAKHGGQ